MLEQTDDLRRINVWVAMADHFLDTETRHDIPLTAMACVRAGLSVAEARDVWRYEVSPAVGFNAWDVAGEWAGWDRDWLVKTVRRVGNRWDVRMFRWLGRRVPVPCMHGFWVSIGRCMQALLETEPPDREPQAARLASLARHYFDFCAADYSMLAAPARQKLRSLYPDPFEYLLAPATTVGEFRLAHQRVRAALRGEQA